MKKESAHPTLIVSSNYRLFVADSNGVEEINMPMMAKSLYLLLLRNPDGILFDESLKARKELIDAYYDITNCSLDADDLQRVINLTEPPTGNIDAISESIRQCFVHFVGKKRAEPFLIDFSDSNVVRIPLQSMRVLWL
jgi:hypothetical protein